MLVAGFLLASSLLKREANRMGRDGQKMVDLAVVTLLIGLLGAKILLILVDLDDYLANPREILGTIRAAGVLYGGIIAGSAGAIWYIKKHQLPVWDSIDIMAPFVALAIAFGRVGCLMAGCCYGQPYHGPFHLIFPENCDAPPGIPLFPTQPLSSLNALLLFGFLWWLLRRRRFEGQVALAFFALYSLSRGMIEFLRGDEIRGIWFGVSTSQIIAACVFVTAAIFYFHRRKAS